MYCIHQKPNDIKKEHRETYTLQNNGAIVVADGGELISYTHALAPLWEKIKNKTKTMQKTKQNQTKKNSATF